MSELFDATDRARLKQRTALIVFVVVFAIFAFFVIINVLAAESKDKAGEKSDTEQIIDLLESR